MFLCTHRFKNSWTEVQLFVSSYSEELELHLSCFTFCLTWLIWGLFQPAAVWPQCEHGRSGDVWTVHPHLWHRAGFSLPGWPGAAGLLQMWTVDSLGPGGSKVGRSPCLHLPADPWTPPARAPQVGCSAVPAQTSVWERADPPGPPLRDVHSTEPWPQHAGPGPRGLGAGLRGLGKASLWRWKQETRRHQPGYKKAAFEGAEILQTRHILPDRSFRFPHLRCRL